MQYFLRAIQSNYQIKTGCSCVLTILLMSCSFRSSRPKAHVGPMEANHPWMIFDPTPEQGMVVPFGDHKDPNILYLGVVLGDGNAIKINLTTKSFYMFRFNVSKWEDIEKHTVKFSHGFRHHNHGNSIQIEFRGVKVEQTVQHMFGDTGHSRLGSYKGVFRTGYYYIVDTGLEKPVEWLRVKVENSELDWGGLGSAYMSPNGEWLVFVLSNKPSRTFIFNRKKQIEAKFTTNRDYQTIEVIK